MPRVYVSGPMTGLPAYNYPAFEKAAAHLRALGWDVDNPAEHFDGATDLDRTTYMRSDIESLLNVDAVATLPGWENSVGAKLEVQIAHELGLDVFPIEKARRIEKQVAEEPPASEALRLVDGDRQADYGHPLDDFGKTALIWQAILGVEVTPEQVALCMVGVKISRECNRPKRDNIVDGIGYFQTLWMVQQERARRGV